MSGTARLEIVKLVGGGRGLAHHDGATWMVAGALPGELVEARPVLRRRGVVEAETLRVLDRPHPARESDPCPHAPACGGCDWPHVDARRGAQLKAAVAAEAARGAPQLAQQLADAPVQASPLAYRLRCRLHWDPRHRELGFYGRRSRRINAIPHCRIVSPRLAASVPALADALAASCPVAADLEWLEDLSGGVAVLALRTAASAQVRPGPHHLPTAASATAVVDGCHLLKDDGRLAPGWGATGVRMALPVPLEVPVGAFFQGNRYLVPWLFERVSTLLGPAPAPVWDLHGGVGLLAAAAVSAGAREIVLVEPVVAAAEAARRNLPAATVAVGRTAEQYLADAPQPPREAVVITDPPRSGMTAQLREQLASWRPRHILTLGCDPATWARDTRALGEHGYRITSLELVDLFPSTHHVEVVALLESG